MSEINLQSCLVNHFYTKTPSSDEIMKGNSCFTLEVKPFEIILKSSFSNCMGYDGLPLECIYHKNIFNYIFR